MVITSEIVCRTGTVRGQAKKNNVSIPRKTGKSTIVTHGTIRVNGPSLIDLHFKIFLPCFLLGGWGGWAITSSSGPPPPL